MHTIQSWSINSSFVFTKPYFYFVLQSFNNKSSKHPWKHPPFTKEIPFTILATARKNIDDNLRPAILHSGTRSHYWQYNRIRMNQLAGTDAAEQPICNSVDNPNIKDDVGV
jgi:muramoyltetrapeptide carboxypeptidase